MADLLPPLRLLPVLAALDNISATEWRLFSGRELRVDALHAALDNISATEWRAAIAIAVSFFASCTR